MHKSFLRPSVNSPTRRLLATKKRGRLLAASVIETLESRKLLSASVTVHVYNDPNQNSTGTSNIAGRQVFVDLSGDGVLESGDPTAITGSDGTAVLSLASVTTATCKVGEILPEGVGQTVPASTEQSVTVSNPATVSFGNLTLSGGTVDPGGNFTQYSFSNLNSNQIVTTAVTQPDGKLVVAGVDYSTYNTFVARYFPNGVPDTNFSGPDGIVTSLGAFVGTTPGGLVVEPDGDIIVALNSNGSGNPQVVAITPQGGQDGTFNKYAPPVVAHVNGLSLMVDGSLLLTTVCYTFVPEKVEVFDLSPTTGLISSSFGNGLGYVPYTPPTTNSNAAAGSVLTTVDASGGFYMVMYDDQNIYFSSHAADGSHISTHGSIAIDSLLPTAEQGYSQPDFEADAVTPLPNGDLVVAGTAISAVATPSGDFERLDMVLVEITSIGTLDTSFNNSGIVSTTDSALWLGSEAVASVAALPTGEILVTDEANYDTPGNGPNDTLTYNCVCREFNASGGALNGYSSGATNQLVVAVDSRQDIAALALASGVLPKMVSTPSRAVGQASPHFVNGGVGFYNTYVPPVAMVTGPAVADLNVETTAPTATWQTPSPSQVTAYGSTAPELVQVEYKDAVAVDPRTLATGNLQVKLPGTNGATETPTYIGLEKTGNNQDLFADYSVPAPSGGWTNANNGDYTLKLLGNQVSNGAHPAASATLGTFNVNISAPVLDTTPPTAKLATVPSVTTAGTTPLSLVVTYSDNAAVLLSSIGKTDLTVTGPGGTVLSVTAANASVTTNAASIVVTYTVAAPPGGWAASNNGPYSVALNAGAVTDTSANAVTTGTLGGFSVAVGVPFGALTAVAPVTTTGVASVSLTVTYTDSSAAIRAASISDSNLLVTGPGGTLSVTGASAGTPTVVSGQNQLSVTYTIAAPAGTFVSGDNGTYSVALAAGQVLDASSTAAVAATLGSFVVAVGIPSGALTAVPPVTTTGVTALSLDVTYSDSTAAISTASIHNSNLVVTGPGGTALSITGETAGTQTLVSGVYQMTVTYTLAAPSGSFAYTDDGTYTVALGAGQVLDASGTAAIATTIGGFVVDIPAPTDTTPVPVASSVTLGIPVTTVQSGNVLLLSATVAGADGGVPTGTVSFMEGATLLSTQPLVSGTANFSSADLSSGSITAVYSGDANYASSTSAAKTVTVTTPPAGAGQLTPGLGKAVLPATVIVAGTKHNLTVPVLLTNTGGQTTNGIVHINLYASADGALHAGDQLVGTLRKGLKLKAGKNGTLVLHLSGLPATLGAGSYHLLAQVVDSAGFAQSAITSATVTVAAPVVTPVVSFAKVTLPASVTSGEKVRGSVALSITNNGNVPITGPVTIQLYLTPDGVAKDGTLIKTLVLKKLPVGAGKAAKVNITPGLIPAIAAGSYQLAAVVQTSAANGAVAQTAGVVDSAIINVSN